MVLLRILTIRCGAWMLTLIFCIISFRRELLILASSRCYLADGNVIMFIKMIFKRLILIYYDFLCLACCGFISLSQPALRLAHFFNTTERFFIRRGLRSAWWRRHFELLDNFAECYDGVRDADLICRRAILVISITTAARWRADTLLKAPNYDAYRQAFTSDTLIFASRATGAAKPRALMPMRKTFLLMLSQPWFYAEAPRGRADMIAAALHGRAGDILRHERLPRICEQLALHWVIFPRYCCATASAAPCHFHDMRRASMKY